MPKTQEALDFGLNSDVPCTNSILKSRVPSLEKDNTCIMQWSITETPKPVLIKWTLKAKTTDPCQSNGASAGN